MPDGTRKRRYSSNRAKREWYALHRSRRWKRRFFGDDWGQPKQTIAVSPPEEGVLATA